MLIRIGPHIGFRFLNGTLSLSSALGSMIIRTMDQSVDSKSLCIVNLKIYALSSGTEDGNS
ncbi:hypothetical protein BLOT_012818 [Blomia tropicalis]|nr:hypothetical protein BLOT_012818 [Blomia tropicalis]